MIKITTISDDETYFWKKQLLFFNKTIVIMCFSASTSFIASVVLGSVGVVALKKAKSSSMKIFALTPMLFAIQQFAEGVVWVTLSNPEGEFAAMWLSKAVYAFLVFAWVVWPVFIPFFMMKLEQNSYRKKILKGILGIGIGVAAILIYILSNYNMTAQVDGYHIRYNLDFQFDWVWVFAIFYLIPTVFSTLISSVKKMWYLGVINIASYVFTKIFFAGYVISIWCFFGAVSSLVVLAIILEAQKKTKDQLGNKFSKPASNY